MVRYISTNGVMYLGTLVEVAESNELIQSDASVKRHCFLQFRCGSLKARAHKRIQLKGELPSPMNIPEGCRFVTRCPYATEACKNGVPKLQEISKGHSVACHRAKEIL
ncbi:MAG: oligopeptide/dipeptide ABC transporter ATP-binding protein [Coprococcus comes]